ncbi:MAG: DUF1800 domain-containing protein, partial [Gammaproteobacteria bacterium]
MVTVQAVIAANRFGLGARPGELDEISQDHEGWLLAQLRPGASTARDSLPGSAEILREFQRLQRLSREARRSDGEERAEAAQQAYRSFIRTEYQSQATRRYELAAVTEAPFRERLVHFWTNHFAVSADKQAVTPLAGTLEEEAIRPHVPGRFVDMLLAVEKHPAMLLYLDNQASMGPNSRAARAATRRGRDLGLNENLAREILELHTLGVDGGYSQEDVTTFAKVLTGWSVGGGQGRDAGSIAGEFFFRASAHEPGAKTMLGNRYREEGIGEGEAVLADLAMHPATAHFLAEKLARHFVADEPPGELVEVLAQAYLDHDGELNSVYEALVSARTAWVEPLAKYKTPQDFLISTYRAFNQQPENPERMIAFLDILGQRPYTPGSPAGWPDTMAHWDGGDALMKRIEWAASAGRRIGDRARPVELGEAILGPVFDDHTRTAVSRAESSAQGLT